MNLKPENYRVDHVVKRCKKNVSWDPQTKKRLTVLLPLGFRRPPLHHLDPARLLGAIDMVIRNI